MVPEPPLKIGGLQERLTAIISPAFFHNQCVSCSGEYLGVPSVARHKGDSSPPKPPSKRARHVECCRSFGPYSVEAAGVDQPIACSKDK